MTDIFCKFPTTPHLANSSNVDVRDSKIFSLSEQRDFLSHELYIEEKIDGACLGISFDGHGNLLVQNRGSYLSAEAGGQWKNLWGWLDWRTDNFFENLTDKYILFGEWCYAYHSIFYNHLPDWFVGFDIYDKAAKKFLSRSGRDSILRSVDVSVVPFLGSGHYSFSDLQNFFGVSKFGDSEAEGVYLRYDDGDWLGGRAKLVNPEFVQSITEHWSQGSLRMNRLRSMTDAKAKAI